MASATDRWVLSRQAPPREGTAAWRGAWSHQARLSAARFPPPRIPATTHPRHHASPTPRIPSPYHHASPPPRIPATTHPHHHASPPPRIPATTHPHHHASPPLCIPATMHPHHHASPPPRIPTTTYPNHHASPPPRIPSAAHMYTRPPHEAVIQAVTQYRMFSTGLSPIPVVVEGTVYSSWSDRPLIVIRVIIKYRGMLFRSEWPFTVNFGIKYIVNKETKQKARVVKLNSVIGYSHVQRRTVI